MTRTTVSTNESIVLAGWARNTRRSALQDMLSLCARPGILSLALGLPAPELFPAQAYAKACADTLADPRSLQYGPPSERLKVQIVGLMEQRGVKCGPEQVFLTAGAQQAMNLLARLLLDAGGKVCLEELSYTGFHQVIEPFEPELLTVRTDPDTGMDVDSVEAMLRRGTRPAFIYAMTDGHNPVSVGMALKKREALVGLARHYGVPILEDDAYGFLYYDRTNLPPLRAFDEGHVFYIGSFSKIMAPALRAGWIIAPEELMARLSIVKEASDIDTSTFSQRAISAYLDSGHLGEHLACLRTEYRARRDAMLRALGEHFPRESKWRTPGGGLFVWVELPEGVDAEELLRISIETEHVAFLPGSAFSVGRAPRARNCLRLNFSNNPAGRIEEGVGRLGRALKSVMR